MFKKLSPGFVVVSVVVLILSSLMISTASAQEGTVDPNTPVSNVDGILPMAEASSNDTVSEPFAGSGKLAPESAQLAGPNSTAAPAGGANPESVIGADGRTQVTATTAYPNRAIAYLLITWSNNTQVSCTGWFIGYRTVATAGHCVFNTGTPGHGWAKSIVVYPGRKGATIPFGSTTAHKLWAVAGWTGSTGNPVYDYGVIQTNAELGKTVGYFGYAWQSSNSFPGSYTVRGYPGDKPTATMWTMSGAITAVNASRLWYNIDTFGGQSGSPLYKGIDGKCCYGFGFHTYGGLGPNPGNSATRITHLVFNNMVAWKNAAYP